MRRLIVVSAGLLAACSGVAPDPAEIARGAEPSNDPEVVTELLERADRALADARRTTPPELDAWREAEGLLLRAGRIAPGDGRVALRHAEMLAFDGHSAAAAERIEAALRLGATDRAALQLAADLRYRRGEEAAALPWLRALVGRDPEHAESWYRLAQCEARLAAAELAREARVAHLEAARSAFARYRELCPGDADGWLGEAEVTAALIDEAAGPERGLAAVLELYDAAATRAPAAPEPHFGRGVTLEALGRDAAAREAYRAALAAAPAHAPSLLNLGRSLAEAGREVEAAAVLERALATELRGDERERIEAWLRER